MKIILSTRFTIVNAISTATLIALSAATVGCKSPDQKVRDERKEAVSEVGAAATKVQETKQEGAERVSKESDPTKIADEKVQATKDLAEAKKELGDEKVEATKEISQAEIDAGQGGTFRKE